MGRNTHHLEREYQKGRENGMRRHLLVVSFLLARPRPESTSEMTVARWFRFLDIQLTTFPPTGARGSGNYHLALIESSAGVSGYGRWGDQSSSSSSKNIDSPQPDRIHKFWRYSFSYSKTSLASIGFPELSISFTSL